MRHFIQEFFGISGVIAWSVFLTYIISDIRRRKYSKKIQEAEDITDMWCEECQQETEHTIYGAGFSQTYICNTCKEVN